MLAKNLRSFVAALVACFTLPSVARAAEAAQTPLIPIAPERADSVLVAALTSIEGEPLTLAGAYILAVEGATSVHEADAALRAAKSIAQHERGAFDPELFATVNKRSDELPTASPFSGAEVLETEDVVSRAGARVTLPFGTELEGSFDMTRSETNSAFASLDPQYAGAGRLALRQPLLNRFGPSTRAALSSANLDTKAAEAARADAEAGLRATIEGTYWDLYAAQRDYAVQLVLVDRATALVRDVRTRARAGLVGPDQVANADVFLAEREQAALDAEQTMDQLSDRLASLIGTRPPGALRRYRPTDAPPDSVDVEEESVLVTRAIESNHALRAMRARVQSLRALERGARWSALPDLDVVGSVGGNGLSGTPQTVIFGTDTLRTNIDGNGSDVWDQVVGRDFPSWSVGVELTLPLGLREGRGERGRLSAEVVRLEQQRIALQRTIEEDVRANSRELQQGAKRLESARRGVRASFEQVRIGLVEYRNGRTTAFELVRLGSDLASAEERLSQALVRMAKAQASLRYLTGEPVD